MREVNIFFFLCVYIKFLDGNYCEDFVYDKIFLGVRDEGFRDEIGLCIRDGKGF